MTFANFGIVEVMRWGDLDAATTELGVDIFVGNNGDFTPKAG